jgi:hypothetical protein
MGDTVKVTVIATGFTKPEDKRESVIEPKPVAEFFADRTGDPAYAPLPEHPLDEPGPTTSTPLFEEELDVPAYLRQGKLLN